MPADTSRSAVYRRIDAVVRRIPRGRVATYGQVAALAGRSGQARQVGYAMHSLPDGTDVPWQRVINARGEVSQRSEPFYEPLQRTILEAEGVVFDERGGVDLERFRWEPGPGEAAAARPSGVGKRKEARR